MKKQQYIKFEILGHLGKRNSILKLGGREESLKIV